MKDEEKERESKIINGYKVREYIGPSQGSVWYSSIEPVVPDPGFCGIGRWTLGKWDPLWEACRLAHDPTFDDLLIGKITKSQLATLRDFGKALAKKWGKAVINPFSAKAAYTLVAAPLYFLFGGVLGMVRYRQLIKKGMVKQSSDSGEMY